MKLLYTALSWRVSKVSSVCTWSTHLEQLLIDGCSPRGTMDGREGEAASGLAQCEAAEVD